MVFLDLVHLNRHEPRNSSVFSTPEAPQVSEPVELVAAPALATNSSSSHSGGTVSGGGTGGSSAGTSNECFFSFNKALYNTPPHVATGSMTAS